MPVAFISVLVVSGRTRFVVFGKTGLAIIDFFGPDLFPLQYLCLRNAYISGNTEVEFHKM